MITSVPRFSAAVLASLGFLVNSAPPAQAQAGRGTARQGLLAPSVGPYFAAAYGYSRPGDACGIYPYGYWGPYYNALSNPFGGYLAGAADLTRANAEYHRTIQDARLVREAANRSAIDSRRKWIEEVEWERAEWLKKHAPEVVRQQDQAWELNRARHHPPLVDILSARALNALFAQVARQQAQGERGPKIVLREDVLKGINLTGQDTVANAGLLKHDGRLQWPLPLEGSDFAGSRERIGRLIAEAVDQARNSQAVDPGKLRDLYNELGRLNTRLVQNARDASRTGDGLFLSQYIEAKRYVDQVSAAGKALENPSVANYLNDNWVTKGPTVAELVKYMSEKGLTFAPAVPGDADSYRALYRALQAFDAGINSAAAPVRSVAANAPAEPR
jgi:hypothetical protein